MIGIFNLVMARTRRFIKKVYESVWNFNDDDNILWDDGTTIDGKFIDIKRK